MSNKLRRGLLEQLIDLVGAVRAYPNRAWTQQCAFAGMNSAQANEYRTHLIENGLLLIEGNRTHLTCKGFVWFKTATALKNDIDFQGIMK